LSLINQPVTKYKFEGIGETVAALVVAGLSANPQFAWLVKGFLGRVVWFGAKLAGMGFASLGLVVLNVGAAKIDTIVTHGNFDGSWDSARKLIAEIQKEGRELTDEEKARIDEPVKAAFRKFGRFARMRKR
jgi:hypothetical protein